MPIEVEGPDGKVHSFPDNTSHEQINSQMSSLYGGGGALSAIQPQAGDATAASGNVMPNMQSTPSYRTREDNMNLALGAVFPHMQQIIQNTPGHALRMEAAKTAGKNLGNLEERQRAGLQVLDALNLLGETADQGFTEGNLSGAIGPVESIPLMQRIRASIPLVGSAYEKEYNLHNRLMHAIHGLTTEFVASASKGGINMSDARQKAFEETMGAMMSSTTKEEFDKIRHDAERVIRGTFGLAPGVKSEPQRSSRVQEPQQPTIRQQFRNQKTGTVDTFELIDGQWKKAQ